MGNYKIITERQLEELEEKIMKRIKDFIMGFIVVVLIAGLSACGKAEEKIETRADYYISLAKEVEKPEELYNLINEYSDETEKQESFKAQLALLEGNDTIQLALLASEDLTSELMVSILQNHKWVNIRHAGTRAFLMEKISSMSELTPIQEIQIADIGEETYQAGLLAKPDVSCDTLCYLLNKGTTKLNLEYYEYQEWIRLQACREDWTQEEKERLLETGNKNVKKVFRVRKEVE